MWNTGDICYWYGISYLIQDVGVDGTTRIRIQDTVTGQSIIVNRSELSPN